MPPPQILRKIPITMATQHPDNAHPAPWCGKKFINTHDEIEEAYYCFKELNCGEYMWDWEGKFVDESVIDKFFRNYSKFFKKHALGKEFFLTFRIPNIWEEKGYRLTRVFMNILSFDDFAQEIGLHHPPIFEIILPMTKNAEQLIYLQRTFKKIAELKNRILDQNNKTKHSKFKFVNIIPLFEGVEDLVNSGKVLERYIKLYEKEFKEKPSYLRPFIARSDPALNAGIIPAVISAKVALTQMHKLGKKYNIAMFPIFGTGSLPFRGGVNPTTIHETIQEYAGIRTLTIQSAFRYDYPKEKVNKALKLIRRSLPHLKPNLLTPAEIKNVEKMNVIFKKEYKSTIEKLAPLINHIAALIPGRRERMLHIGLFGYSRGEGKIQLPRAIRFTAAFYSLGVPPEFIGTGVGLQKIKELGLQPLLEKLYLNLVPDLVHAGKYLNKENLAFLAKKYPPFKKIQKSIQLTEEYLGRELGPYKNHHFIHRNLTSTIFHKFQMKTDFTAEIEQAAELRKSLG